MFGMFGTNEIPDQKISIPPPPTPRKRETGQTELLLQYVEKLTGRNLSRYESELLLTIVRSVLLETQELIYVSG